MAVEVICYIIHHEYGAYREILLYNVHTKWNCIWFLSFVCLHALYTASLCGIIQYVAPKLLKLILVAFLNFNFFVVLFQVVMDAVNKPRKISYKGLTDLVTE